MSSCNVTVSPILVQGPVGGGAVCVGPGGGHTIPIVWPYSAVCPIDVPIALCPTDGPIVLCPIALCPIVLCPIALCPTDGHIVLCPIALCPIALCPTDGPIVLCPIALCPTDGPIALCPIALPHSTLPHMCRCWCCSCAGAAGADVTPQRHCNGLHPGTPHSRPIDTSQHPIAAP